MQVMIEVSQRERWDATLLLIMLYGNRHNLCVHQLLRLYLRGTQGIHVTSDVIRTIVVRRRPNRMLTYVIT